MKMVKFASLFFILQAKILLLMYVLFLSKFCSCYFVLIVCMLLFFVFFCFLVCLLVYLFICLFVYLFICMFNRWLSLYIYGFIVSIFGLRRVPPSDGGQSWA